MSFSTWSTTASENVSVGGVNIAEGCPAANVNNGERAIMAEMRAAINPSLDDALADGTIGQVTGNVAALAGLTLAADKLPYATGATALALTALTPFARSMLDDADAATVRTTIGALGIAASSLANPGYLKLSNGFVIQWGQGTASANANASVSYPTAFSSFSIPVLAGGQNSTSAQNNYPAIYAATTSGFSYASSANSTASFWWIAVGV